MEHETALFALGDFRDAETRLGLTRGVCRTSLGEAGGMLALMVEYIPQTISYGQLLELLMCWYGSKPGTAIFFRTEKERRLAQAAVERSALLGGHPARVLPFKTFRES